MLSDTENAVFSLRMQKHKLVDRINAIEQNFVLSNMGDTGGQAQSDSGSSSFLNNPYFVKSIDPDDYKELLRVQKMEAETQDFVSAYMKTTRRSNRSTTDIWLPRRKPTPKPSMPSCRQPWMTTSS